jgi:hypothetical protein
VNVVTALVANRQTAILAEPRQGAFNHPAVTPKALLGFDADASNPTENPFAVQVATATAHVVALVRVEFVGAFAGTAPGTFDRRDGLDQLFEDGLVRDIGGGEEDREGDAVAVDNEVTLRARLAPIRRIRPGFRPPFLAGTLAASSAARSQSIWSASPKVFKRCWCNRSHTPALPQSRKRRQQVMPQPQFISWGSISQGIPLFKTNKMPVRAARLGMRGRPPFGLGRSGGSNGSTVAHS